MIRRTLAVLGAAAVFLLAMEGMAELPVESAGGMLNTTLRLTLAGALLGVSVSVGAWEYVSGLAALATGLGLAAFAWMRYSPRPAVAGEELIFTVQLFLDALTVLCAYVASWMTDLSVVFRYGGPRRVRRPRRMVETSEILSAGLPCLVTMASGTILMGLVQLIVGPVAAIGICYFPLAVLCCQIFAVRNTIWLCFGPLVGALVLLMGGSTYGILNRYDPFLGAIRTLSPTGFAGLAILWTIAGYWVGRRLIGGPSWRAARRPW